MTGSRISLRLIWMLVLFFAAAAESEEEKEEVTDASIAIAATLLGGITFMMTIFCCMHHPDEDMRKYTYDVLSQTISIFCAVLCFQTFNHFLEIFIDKYSLEIQSLFDMCHMLLWFVILQLTLGGLSGVGKKHHEPTTEEMEKIELSMRCWGVILAHLTGFSAINAWGSIQQLPFFHKSRAMPFTVLPIAALGLFLLQQMSDKARNYVALADDDEIDELEALWNDEADEALVDVMALTLSFGSAQSCRFFISGIMPDPQGEESLADLRSHGTYQALWLFGCALVDVSIMVICYAKRKTITGMLERKCCTSEKLAYQIVLVTNVTVNMCFSWCVFYSFQWLLGSIPLLATADRCVLQVVLTMTISVATFCSIYWMDKLADADWTDEDVDEQIRHIISSLSLTVGFAWESAFDQAIDALSTGLDQKIGMTRIGFEPGSICKIVLTIFVMLLVAPAWKWWIIPMVEKDGWKIGIVWDNAKLQAYNEHLLQINELRKESLLAHRVQQGSFSKRTPKRMLAPRRRSAEKNTRTTIRCAQDLLDAHAQISREHQDIQSKWQRRLALSRTLSGLSEQSPKEEEHQEEDSQEDEEESVSEKGTNGASCKRVTISAQSQDELVGQLANIARADELKELRSTNDTLRAQLAEILEARDQAEARHANELASMHKQMDIMMSKLTVVDARSREGSRSGSITPPGSRTPARIVPPDSRTPTRSLQSHSHPARLPLLSLPSDQRERPAEARAMGYSPVTLYGFLESQLLNGRDPSPEVQAAGSSPMSGRLRSADKLDSRTPSHSSQAPSSATSPGPIRLFGASAGDVAVLNAARHSANGVLNATPTPAAHTAHGADTGAALYVAAALDVSTWQGSENGRSGSTIVTST